MLECDAFFKVLHARGVNYFAGVPDSAFKEWMKFLDDNHNSSLINRIAAIERDAVSWAAAYHVATGKIGVVYMQNSGLGNAVNPVTSLVDPEVYNIPLLYMIGWRGEPSIKDEPQHIKMGQITIPLLELLGINYDYLPDEIEKAERVIHEAVAYVKRTGASFAFIIRRGTFREYKKRKIRSHVSSLLREEAIAAVVDNLENKAVIVSTTGKTSRELFEYRESKGQGHDNDFLMVGSMGCASSFGAEIALQKPDRRVYVLDGDAAFIMSMGVLSTIGYYAPANFIHVVLDNGSHESTGGQPTTAETMDIQSVALSNGYKYVRQLSTREQLQTELRDIQKKAGPCMLIVSIQPGSRPELGRPTLTPVENKKLFMELLKRI